jgi:citrate/tricarballylate utilization protein
MPLADTLNEARRVMEVCNACRYCEGYCAVFPAMTQRRGFADADLEYLANLCHHCGACYYACQYAPPHEFGVNVPRAMADLRADTYEKYAWPQGLGGVFRRNGVLVSLALILALALAFALAAAFISPETLFTAHRGADAFYAVVPHAAMVGAAGGIGLLALLALGLGALRYRRATAPAGRGAQRAPRLRQALADTLSLRYLGGGGDGCNDRGEAYSNTRRWLHQSMLYGFALCFAATCVATLYDYALGRPAPYPVFSLPVVLGTVGGIGLLIGSAGLFALKFIADPAPAMRRMLGMDIAFLALLFLTALSGLLLLALRATPAMGTLLVLHLGIVLALFATLPYGKFVHAVYRFAALLQYAGERADGPNSNGD